MSSKLDSGMRGTLAILRREVGALVDSPVAWVSAALFVLGLHSVFYFLGFPVGDLKLPGLWAGRLASLETLFAWLPLAYCVLAPALSMGAWADEESSGTAELLLTLPLRTGELVLGKFLAAWLYLGLLTTVAVLPVAVMVGQLGPLDWGTVWCGLFGAWMLAAVCVSASLVASAASRDSLVAFLAASAALLVLWSAGLYVRILPGSLADAVWYASPTLHFLESGAHGVLDLRDVVYYALFVIAGLVLNVAVVEARRSR